MYTLNDLPDIDSKLIALALVFAPILAYFGPFLSDRYGLLGYPGPLLAKVSNLWFAQEILKGTNATTVHKLHKKYGTKLRRYLMEPTTHRLARYLCPHHP